MVPVTLGIQFLQKRLYDAVFLQSAFFRIAKRRLGDQRVTHVCLGRVECFDRWRIPAAGQEERHGFRQGNVRPQQSAQSRRRVGCPDRPAQDNAVIIRQRREGLRCQCAGLSKAAVSGAHISESAFVARGVQLDGRGIQRIGQFFGEPAGMA